MKGKMRTLYGIYKKHGRDAFLDAAKDYSAHVRDTVEDTLAEMESRWYDGGHTMTEAEKMVDDYNHGLTALNTQQYAEPVMAQPEMRMWGESNEESNDLCGFRCGEALRCKAVYGTKGSVL